jgi:hypothetical protein
MKTQYFVATLTTVLVIRSYAQAVWDLESDFVTATVPPVNLGPDGAWSYGYDKQIDDARTAPFVFAPFPVHGPKFGLGDAYNIPDPDTGFLEKIENTNLPKDAGGLVVHTALGENEPVIIRWKAPRAMTVVVSGQIYKMSFDVGNGRTQDFYIRKNNDAWLVSGTVSDSTLNNTSPIAINVGTPVNAGDLIDLALVRTPGKVQGFIGFKIAIREVAAGSPLVTAHPKNTEVAPGGNATLSVQATGAAPLSYQWYKNNAPISGQTAATLNLSNVGVNDAGFYHVIVKNAQGQQTSSTAVVDVVSAASNTHDLGAEFSLQSNPTPRAWQYSRAVAQGGGIVGGVTLTWNEPDFGAGQPGWAGVNPPGVHAGWARRINNGNDTPTFDDPVGTVITHGPTSVTWTAPATDTNRYATLSGGLWNIRHLGRSGAWKLWKNAELLTDGTLNDNSGTSSNPKALSQGSGGGDALVAAYKAGDLFRLEILEEDFVGVKFAIASAATAPDPFITKQIENQEVPPGSTVTFSVQAIGSGTLTYQWFRNSTAISGATQPALTINNVGAADLGDYQVAVTSAGGTRRSRIAKLTTSQQPVGTPWNLVGNWVKLNLPPVNIGPEGAWSYGIDATTSDPFLAPFNFQPFPLAGNGQPHLGQEAYYIAPSDPGGSAIHPNGLGITSHTSSGPNQQPIIFRWTAKRPITVNVSGSAYKVVAENNGRTQDFFLRKNSQTNLLAKGTVSDNTTLIDGTAITFNITGISLNPGDFLDYAVARTPNITQGFIDVTLQVVEAPTGTPHIDVHPGPATQTAPLGGTVTLNVQATGSGTLNYQWKKNGVDLPGKTAATLTISSASVADSGDYTVTVKNVVGSTTSDIAHVDVDATPPTLVSATRDFLNQNAVILVFSEPISAATASATGNFAINNGVTVSAATPGSSPNTVVLTTSKITGTQAFEVTINGVKDAVGNPIAANTKASIIVPGDTVRLQDSGVDGLLVLEAEHFNRNAPQGEHSWVLNKSIAGFSGEGAMLATPDTERNSQSDIVNTPRLDFKAQFVKTGVHYIWVRGLGDSAPGPSQNDSVLVGLDGVLPSNQNRVTGFAEGAGYVWSNAAQGGGAPPSFQIPIAGLHQINIGMREDGFLIDKIVITSNAGYSPTGAGPAESAVAPTEERIQLSISRSGNTLRILWTGGGVLESSANVTSGWAQEAANSPADITITGSQKFFRVKK